MYKLTKDGVVYTIPEQNIGIFAYMQAADRGVSIDPNNIDMAIAFLREIGIEVSEWGY